MEMIELLNTEAYERNIWIKADETQLKWELVKISGIKQGEITRWKIPEEKRDIKDKMRMSKLYLIKHRKRERGRTKATFEVIMT